MIGSREGHRNQPHQRHERDWCITRLAHFYDDRRGDTERNRSQQLIGDSEQRPERVDSSQRILDPLPQKISPGRNNQGTGGEDRGIPTGAAERLPDVTEGVLHHEAADARASVENGENEQRLEHDGEVIPERHHGLAAKTVRKDVRHANRKGRSTAGTVVEGLLADSLGQRMHLSRGDRKSPIADGSGGGLGRLAHNSGRTVDREVGAGLENASGNGCHDRDHGFSHHGPVADYASLGFARNQFRSSTTRDQRVKAADRPAGNRNKCERKDFARENRSGTVNEAGQRGHVQRGAHGNDTKRE